MPTPSQSKVERVVSVDWTVNSGHQYLVSVFSLAFINHKNLEVVALRHR